MADLALADLPHRSGIERGRRDRREEVIAGQLFDELDRLEIPDGTDVRLVVVDNDPNRSADEATRTRASPAAAPNGCGQQASTWRWTSCGANATS